MPESNRLLAALPPSDFRRLAAHLERVILPKNKILHVADEVARHAFFVLGGMVSLQAIAPQGTTVEIATVGAEGLVGLPIIFGPNRAPYEAVVQIPGPALRITADALLAEFRRCSALQELLLRYTHVVLAQTSQSVVCHRFHTAAQRLSRWLLTARDHAAHHSIHLTQERIAHVLGVPRTRISAAAAQLQETNVIRFRHGTVTILNAARLQASSCECYQIVRDAIDDGYTIGAHPQQ